MLDYLSPLLSLPGASAPHGDEDLPEYAGVAWHYGDPLVEQRTFGIGAGVVDRTNRRIISVSGEDAPTFLNNLLSQKLDELTEGGTQALDLDGQGRILHHMGVLVADGSFYLDVPAPQAESLLGYLTKMIFWSKVEIAEADLGLLTVVGPDAPQVASTFDGLKRDTTLGIDLYVPRTDIDSVARALRNAGTKPAGLMAYTAERVKALIPEIGIDMDEKSIPHESPVLIDKAVHLHKGCYRGQETVARVDNLGRSPRALVMVHIDGSSPEQPKPSEPITSGGRAVGRMGTVVHDMDFGPIALALIKRSALGSPELLSGFTALNIDPDSLPRDEGVKPGRAAINKLKGL